MDAREKKKKILHDLECGKYTVEDSLAGLSEEAAVRAPAPGKWSALECVEHLAVSEDYLLSQIAVSHPTDAPMMNRSRESLILERGVDRTRKVQSPEVGKPKG